MDFLRRKQPENQLPKESFTVDELVDSLTRDGFVVKPAFKEDLERYGLVTGIVIVGDGADGLRVWIDVNGIPRMLTYNDLRRGNDRLAVLARQKYERKAITLG
jgi:hypothetical protein